MVQAIHLSKTFQNKQAVNNLNLSIAPGHIFCLLGANGAGKTTTINMFLNFIQPSEGKALINGHDVVAAPSKARESLAYIPENLMLYPNLSGVENLDYFSGLAGKSYSKVMLQEFLAAAGLSPEAHQRRVSAYSKGMRQKVGIAIAIARKASVLLLDEPTSGLDPKASNEFATLLKNLSEGGMTTLMATHDLFRAKESGTHIGIMKSGHLVDTFPTEAVTHSELEQLYLSHMQD